MYCLIWTGRCSPWTRKSLQRYIIDIRIAHFAPLGYEPKALLEGVWQGTKEMVNNDGRRTNEEVFWDTFSGIFGERVLADRGEFEKFYAVRFDAFREACGYNPAAGETVRKLRKAGHTVVLATNPVFPMTAQRKRLHWAGTEESDFALITSYENSRACKPNVRYYEEILQKNRRVGVRLHHGRKRRHRRHGGGKI